MRSLTSVQTHFCKLVCTINIYRDIWKNPHFFKKSGGFSPKAQVLSPISGNLNFGTLIGTSIRNFWALSKNEIPKIVIFDPPYKAVIEKMTSGEIERSLFTLENSVFALTENLKIMKEKRQEAEKSVIELEELKNAL